MPAFVYDPTNLAILKTTAVDAMNSTLASCAVATGVIPPDLYNPIIFDKALLDGPTIANAETIVNKFLTTYTPTPTPTHLTWPVLPAYNVDKMSLGSIPDPFKDKTPMGSTVSLWVESSLFKQIQQDLAASLTSTKATFQGDWSSAAAHASERRAQTVATIVAMNRGIARGFRVPAELTNTIPNQTSFYAALDAASQVNEFEIQMSKHANDFVKFAMKQGVTNENMLMQFTEAYNLVSIEAEKIAVEVYKVQLETEIIAFDFEVKQIMTKLAYRKKQIDLLVKQNAADISIMKADITQKQIGNYPITLTLEAMKSVVNEYNANISRAEADMLEAYTAITSAVSKATVNANQFLDYLKSTIGGYASAAKNAANSIRTSSSGTEINLTKQAL